MATLVRRAQAGDREAFGRLYARFSRYVHAIVLARARPAQAADLVQDVFVQALDRLDTLREAEAFAGWLAAIARHHVLDAMTRAPREFALDEGAEEPAAPGRSPENDLDVSRILVAVRTLPEAYRETLLLRFVEGLTGPEIADLTGLTPGSVRVNLHRGVRLLKAALGITP